MKKLSLYQKLEMGMTIVFMILAAIFSAKNNLSATVFNLIMFGLCLSNVQESFTKEEIKDLKEQIKVLESK